MRIGKRAVVIPAHSGQRGRIVARSLFRGGLLRKQSRKQRVGGQQSAGTHCHPIQEIPPRNRAVHAEISIALLLTHAMSLLPPPESILACAKITAPANG